MLPVVHISQTSEECPLDKNVHPGEMRQAQSQCTTDAQHSFIALAMKKPSSKQPQG